MDNFMILHPTDPIQNVIREMMVTRGNDSYQMPPCQVINVYAQKYKSNKYDFDMWNQHCMFLLTKAELVAEQIVNGVQMNGDESEFEFYLGKGAYMTDYFNYAASTLIGNNERVGRSFIPIVGVGLGNVKVCDQEGSITQLGVPKAFDSIWLRGIYGHHSYKKLEFDYRDYKVHVGGFAVMRDRLFPLENTIYFVDKPNQVDILFVIEVQW